MDPQYDTLSNKIDDLAHKIDTLATTVVNLQVQTGDGTIKFRLETAEREINELFERGRAQEAAAQARKDAVDDRFVNLEKGALKEKTFWKVVAAIAAAEFTVFLGVVDIALRLWK